MGFENSYPNLYNFAVKSIYTTDVFDLWFGALRDKDIKPAIGLAEQL
jgi:hypothetical protein